MRAIASLSLRHVRRRPNLLARQARIASCISKGIMQPVLVPAPVALRVVVAK
jgi:hypothetical protein